MKKYATVFILVVFISSCATVSGPGVTQKEINAARAELEIKALQFKLTQIKRINEIGYRLARFVPPEDIKGRPRPFIGLFAIDRGDVSRRLYDISAQKGVIVAFVVAQTPVSRAGIQSGDVILEINKKEVSSSAQLRDLIRRLTPGKKTILTILRNGQRQYVPVDIEEIPLDVYFTVVDHHSVNAAAGKREIYATYGLLNFAKSDDEIAAVLAHELAHLSRGHVSQVEGGRVLGFLAALGLGITAEIFSPGSGNAVMRGVGGIGDVFRAKYSRDIEREADYFGTKYFYLAGYDPEIVATFHERFAIEIPQSMVSDYLSTHPSSPERSIRIRKIIKELENTSSSDNHDG